MNHRFIVRMRDAYSRREHSSFMLISRETLARFAHHNLLGLSASLSFYTLLALIPLVLLLFYLLSYLVFSSDDAIVKLAIITSNILPDYSSKIMKEVYEASTTQSAWGLLGLILLLWAVTPLASAMRKTFNTLSGNNVTPPSFLQAKLKDLLSVLGILLLFFTFTIAGFLVEKVMSFFSVYLPNLSLNYLAGAITLGLTSLLIAVFYALFFPKRIRLLHLLAGAFLTAFLWLLMRPGFELFLSLNPHFGAMFGSMKNLFISIMWLYINYVIFLLGGTLITALNQQEILLLKPLFDNKADKHNYFTALYDKYGQSFKPQTPIYQTGDSVAHLYYVLDGEVSLYRNEVAFKHLTAGAFFGVTNKQSSPTQSTAIASAQSASILRIPVDIVTRLLSEYPQASLFLLQAITLQHD